MFLYYEHILKHNLYFDVVKKHKKQPDGSTCSETDSLKEDFFGCTRADLQRGQTRQFWVPFAEIRMIAAQQKGRQEPSGVHSRNWDRDKPNLRVQTQFWERSVTISY